MTDQNLNDAAAGRVLDAAIQVARNAPARRGGYVSKALVYWPYTAPLDALGQELRDRAALDALGHRTSTVSLR